MLQKVETAPKALDHYLPLIGESSVHRIRQKARSLQGARVLHINATAFGGGVAEILQSLVPLMNDVGLEAEWRVIEGTDAFFEVTKACHNGLQGMKGDLTEKMKQIWMEQNRKNAEQLDSGYDFVIVHDPQPAGLRYFHGKGQAGHWIWRCHIDTSSPNPDYWDFFIPYLNLYDAAIFTMPQFVGPGVRFKELAIIPPKIDPLSPKNAPVPAETAREVVARFGIDTTRPLLLQVSRFDPWKDPLGVIDAYRQVKKHIPEVQLALVGSMASDDPEGWYFLDKTIRHAGSDTDIHILHNFHGVGAFEVGCFQTLADVVVQKSLREGFGLVVSEAMWKGKPVVGGKAGGIVLQIVDGETGFLVDSVQACADRVLDLLQQPELRRKMGEKAREHVRHHFLMPKHLEDYLDLFLKLAAG